MSEDPVHDSYSIWNRQHGALETVPIFNAKKFHFYYRTPTGRALLKWLFTHPLVNTLMTLDRYLPSSSADIPEFIARYQIPVEEIEEPLGSFRTFNDFFIRKLRPDARPIAAEPAAVASPCDGQILVFPSLAADRRFQIKGVEFDLRTLLGDDALVAALQGGSVASIYLAPYDYHRVHYPLACELVSRHRRGNKLFAVNPEISMRNGFRPFDVNVRDINVLRAACGTLAMVEVGAQLVGRIVSTSIAPGRHAIGEEKCYFGYGGSSVILVFPPGGVRFDDDLVEQSARGTGTRIRMGERIARIV